MERVIEKINASESTLPQGWKWVKLGEVCDIINGKNQSEVLDPNGKYPIYGSSGIFGYANKYLCNEGTTVIGRKGTINSPIYVSTKFWNVDTAFGLSPKGTLIGKFLFYFCKGFNFHALDKSTTIPSLAKRDLLSIDMVLPPITQQRAIVSKIEELLSDLDKGKQQLELAQQQLKVYRQAVFNLAIKGEANIPIEDVIDSLDQGWSPRCHNEPSPNENIWGVIKTTAVQAGYFLDGENKMLPGNLEPRMQHELKVGDILITRAGPRVRVGVCCMVRQTRSKLLNCDKVYRIKVNPKVVIPEYLEILLNTPKYSKEIGKMKTGISDSGVNLTQKGFLKILLPVPMIKEQKSIVLEIESRLSVCDKVEETINQSLSQAETLRQSILKKAFEGKLLTEVESEDIRVLSKSVEKLTIVTEPLIKNNVETDTHFLKVIAGIKDTDLHAGILAMVIDAHEKSPEHHLKLSHVKGEKIAHLVEAYIGIDLGRNPRKDAAGPDDYPHLKKVESRAAKAGWFRTERLHIGQTYVSKSGMPKIIKRVKEMLPTEDLNKIEKLIQTFLPFELEHAEVIATVYAGWNNLLLDGRTPTDEEIVYESRENWSKRKLTIEREKFFNALHWLRKHEMVPVGVGKTVSKPKTSI
ncbi:restriction endonuclease subunit S [Ohtaekwangia koreensis]|uniref:Restriction endonuclease S subunit n=1 Tax=Ohtaekwangia koreensis TaxID=688867 RepID=A0A1T5M9V3_9BACT|nr:restriction endonuclease subunit S [Ohtaekwangia koreensis]SKC85030.1 Restriction endonuclease S subunit [Ohtaekwangia koreensis]